MEPIGRKVIWHLIDTMKTLNTSRLCPSALIFAVALAAFAGCIDQGNRINGDNSPCGGTTPGIVSQPPYDSPIWHPSGRFIGFNHTPLIGVEYPFGKHCWGEQYFAEDSSGFCLANPDGSNIRRIFPFPLQRPVWSPDGQWIAFDLNNQIFKMRFTGATFDTSTMVQLTSVGSNYIPSWSPDGQWIAYNESVCDAQTACGIWLMPSDGTTHTFLSPYGNFPSWDNSGNRILFITTAVLSSGIVIGDSLWYYDMTRRADHFFMFLGDGNKDNRYAQYSPEGTKIVLWSSGNLWSMDTVGSNLRQISSQGVDVSFGSPFSWSPDGKKIVYTVYRPDNWGNENGVIWVFDFVTGEKTQITFNLASSN